jgi:hypothetical protein
VDDLLLYNSGTGPERLLKQQNVLSSLLNIANQVTDMVNRRRASYLSSIMTEDNDSETIWPCLNEQHLGNLSTGEFFAELAVVPVAGGYCHQRTVTAVQKGYIYTVRTPRGAVGRGPSTPRSPQPIQHHLFCAPSLASTIMEHGHT